MGEWRILLWRIVDAYKGLWEKTGLWVRIENYELRELQERRYCEEKKRILAMPSAPLSQVTHLRSLITPPPHTHTQLFYWNHTAVIDGHPPTFHQNCGRTQTFLGETKNCGRSKDFWEKC